MKTMVIYRSKTGFTKRYAEMVAGAVGCGVMDMDAVRPGALTGCDTLVFGGRLHAGQLDGLKRARVLFKESGAKRFVVFATGAMPNSAETAIEEMWRNNLLPEEREAVPHFYMQAGLCYEKMDLPDRLMMKMASFFIARQKGDTEAAMSMVKSSYDISDRQYIGPLVDCLREG